MRVLGFCQASHQRDQTVFSKFAIYAFSTLPGILYRGRNTHLTPLPWSLYHVDKIWYKPAKPLRTNSNFILHYFYSQTDLTFENKLNAAESITSDVCSTAKQRGYAEEERKIFCQIMRCLGWEQGGLLLHRVNKPAVTTYATFKGFFLVRALMLTTGTLLWLYQYGFIKNTKTPSTYCIGGDNSHLKIDFAQDFQKWIEILNYSNFRYLLSVF